MSQTLPPPATLRAARTASLVLMVTGLVLAMFPALRPAGAALALIFAGFAALAHRNLKRSRASVVHVPPPVSEHDMIAVLASLGVPLSAALTDPQTALRFGMAKAALFRGHSLIERAEVEKGIETLRALANQSAESLDPAMRRVGAAARYRIGLALRAARRTAEAAAEFQAALLLAPDYELARTAAASINDKQI